MLSKLALLFLAAAGSALATDVVTGALGDAPLVKDSPPGEAFVARFNPSDKNPIGGSVLAMSAPDGAGVAFSVSISGLNPEMGPYTYHIHELPVPANGSCAATLLHLDPYQRGQKPVCQPKYPATCEVGDLGGKYGKMAKESFAASYIDPYTSLKKDDVSYFGDLSVVIHNKDGDRVACTNFASIADATKSECSSTGTPTSPGQSNPSSTAPSDQPTPSGPLRNGTREDDLQASASSMSVSSTGFAAAALVGLAMWAL